MVSMLCGLALACISTGPAFAQLPRQAGLGIGLERVSGGSEYRIINVIAGSTAAAMGLKAGDIIPDLGFRARWTNPETAPKAGDLVELTVRRGGRMLRLSGKAIARPLESYAGADTRYGEVAFNGGTLRDILVTPKGVANPPVVFLIQGYSCSSMESANPEDPYRRLGADLIAAGIAYYRVEKAGVGDSAGGEPCSRGDYTTELDGFRTAYRHLVSDLGFARERIFMLGHSMGGLQAPMLAAEAPPRGVAIYGTIVRNWCDYWHDIDSFQEFIRLGEDPVAGYRKGEQNREIFRRYCLGGEDPRQIAATSPALREPMLRALEWDGAEDVSGRHYRYFPQIARINFVEAWATAKTRVLSLYGESDVEALSGEDQRLIVEIVNHYRPGTARFVGMPETGHMMDIIGDRETVRANARRSGGSQPGAFNPKIAAALVEWVRESLAVPPVAVGSPAP